MYFLECRSARFGICMLYVLPLRYRYDAYRLNGKI